MTDFDRDPNMVQPDFTFETAAVNNGPKIGKLSMAGRVGLALGTVVGVPAGLVALSGGDSERDLAAGWHPVDKGVEVDCVDEGVSDDWYIKGKAKSSEASRDPRMDLVETWANPEAESLTSDSATYENPTASLTVVFDGSVGFARIGARASYPAVPYENDSDDQIQWEGSNPGDCLPPETTTTVPETTTTVPETTTTVPETTTTVPETTTTVPETTTTVPETTTTTPNTTVPPTVPPTTVPPTVPPTTVPTTVPPVPPTTNPGTA